MQKTERIITRWIALAIYERKSKSVALTAIADETKATKTAVKSTLMDNRLWWVDDLRRIYREQGREAVEEAVEQFIAAAAINKAAKPALGTAQKASVEQSLTQHSGCALLAFVAVAASIVLILFSIYSKDESERRYDSLSEEGQQYVDDEMEKYDRFCDKNPDIC